MASIIQIFGTKKCSDSGKALRFFKERGIKTQFIDLNEKAMSKGELDSVKKCVPLETLIDESSKEYKNRNLAFIIHDIEEEILNHPLLMRTPITRFGRKAAVGVVPEVWKVWVEESKQ